MFRIDDGPRRLHTECAAIDCSVTVRALAHTSRVERAVHVAKCDDAIRDYEVMSMHPRTSNSRASLWGAGTAICLVTIAHECTGGQRL